MNLEFDNTQPLGNFLQKQEALSFYSVVTSLIFLILTLLIYALNYQELPSQIPLFYSLAWGQEQLVSINQFIILPSIIVLTLLVNLLISWHLHESQKILKRILAISTVLVSILIFTASFKIIYTFV